MITGRETNQEIPDSIFRIMHWRCRPALRRRRFSGAGDFRSDLLRHVATLLIFLQRQEKQAVPIARCFPLVSYLGFFAGFIVQQVRALVLDHRHAAIAQLADEIRVALSNCTNW